MQMAEPPGRKLNERGDFARRGRKLGSIMNARVTLALMIAIGGWSCAGLLRVAVADDKAAAAKTAAPMDPQAKAFGDWQQQMQQQMVKKFDADGDGKLSDAEKLAMQQAMAQQGWNFGMAPGGFPGEQEFLKRFDRNGDGKLDQMESMMAQQAFQKMMGHGGMHGGVRGGGGASGFMPQPAMPLAPQGNGNGNAGKLSALAKRFDKDGDGKLNDEEKATLQADAKKKDGKDAKKEKPKK
jgi:EF hand/EF-hand domain pair